MIFGFDLDGAFLTEDQFLAISISDPRVQRATYSARLTDEDKERIRTIFEEYDSDHPRATPHSPADVEKFLNELDQHAVLSSIATLHYYAELRRPWLEKIKSVLSRFLLKELISRPGGRKAVNVFLQEEKRLPPDELSKIQRTLHKSPKKIRWLLNQPRERGRPPDKARESLVVGSVASVSNVYRHVFGRLPAFESESRDILPLPQIVAHLFASLLTVGSSRMDQFFRRALKRKSL